MTSLVKMVNIVLQVMNMIVLFKRSTHKGGNGWIIHDARLTQPYRDSTEGR